MDKLSVEQVARWLVNPCDIIALENWVGNRENYLGLLPQTAAELEWEQALAIANIRDRKLELQKEISKGKVLDIDWSGEIGALLKITRNLGEALGILLDGWEPVEVLALNDLAAVISPVGIVAPNTKTSVEIMVDTGLDKPQKMLVAVDELVVLPVPAGNKVKLKFKLNRDLRLEQKTNISLEVVAGKLGIVIDMRGRPIALPGVDESGRRRVGKWRNAIREVCK